MQITPYLFLMLVSFFSHWPYPKQLHTWRNNLLHTWGHCFSIFKYYSSTLGSLTSKLSFTIYSNSSGMTTPVFMNYEFLFPLHSNKWNFNLSSYKLRNVRWFGGHWITIIIPGDHFSRTISGSIQIPFFG